MKTLPVPLSNHDILRLSVLSCRDPRSVRKVLAGDPKVRSVVRAAVVAAARKLGIPCPEGAA